VSEKSILIINNGLAAGGIERASVSLANSFILKGHCVTLVALYKKEHFFNLNPGITFYEPSFERNTTSRNIYVLKMMGYLRVTIKKIKPSVILAFGEWTNPFIIIALMGLKIPIFLSDRMSPELMLTKTHRILKRFSYRKANGIIAQTQYAKEILYQRTKIKNIKIIPNPVNIINKVDCPKKKRIVAVGRLSKEKGHRLLIEAFANICDESWELSIVGDGEYRESLIQLSKMLGISGKIIFHGYQKDFSMQLSEALIFVLPSLSEGFPNALLEAMSVPLACISTNCVSGPADIITNGVNGLLVETGNAAALTQAINKLIEDTELREKLAIEAYSVRERYSFDTIIQDYLKFLFKDDK
jgi:GalNAc-alpha-(1->4)-GalNAc-alpha-(1->3)-diNAcBac-PP-undecaprenol alpha-1,4-N-acetyl-D-galactosaminyltransferase